MASGKKFGKPTYSPASLDAEASSTLGRVERRLSAITGEVTRLVRQIVSQEAGEDSTDGGDHEGPGFFDQQPGTWYDAKKVINGEDKEIRNTPHVPRRDD